MQIKDLKWNKTRAQCPHCGGWFTRQGILGHIRFRHLYGGKIGSTERTLDQAHSGQKDAFTKTLDQVFALKASNLLLTAVDMMNREGRLSEELRQNLSDMMLLDYLHKQIIDSRDH